MYSLRLMAVAVLFHGDQLLMMKRSPERTLSPGQWAGVGGHLEPEEIRDPMAACLREVQEETGLTPEDIEGLQLRYILLRLNGSDLRQQFVYIGETRTKQVSQTEEGELYWIPREEILNRDIPYVYRSVLEHWLTVGPTEKLWMATATLRQPNHTGTVHSPTESLMIFTPIYDPGRI